jgi:hypothetical protein
MAHAFTESIVAQDMPKKRKPVWDTVEYAISLLIRFWYKAVIEAKQIDPRPETNNMTRRKSSSPEKQMKVVFMKKPSSIIFGTDEKKAVTFMIEPS